MSGGVDGFDLAVVGIGYIKLVAVEGHADGVLDQGLGALSGGGIGYPARTIAVAEGKQIAPHQRFNGPRAIHGKSAYRADFTIGDVKIPAIASQAAGLWKTSRCTRTILDVFLTFAGKWGDEFCLQVQSPDLMETCHGDVKHLSIEPE